MGASSQAQPNSGRLLVSRSRGEPVVVALTGELDVSTVLIGARALAEVLLQLPSPQVVLVDLSELRRLAGAGVRMLHAAADHAVGQQTSVRIALGTNPLVARVFALTGMDGVLDVYPDRATALRAGDRDEFLRLADRLWNG